ncbi:hypothetical protein HYFRA_00011702 [Hymenoscyphus fraxineus]|uniref:Glycosyltransferase family 32 protein n=1 Tax=Hymenoscyphus fraxineus TaxID=746836 RepID=A0A9N9L004_9HELO|nr:hypothetical protein HYFRA_00011702 [Hymenoscyphus fraxineus]
MCLKGPCYVPTIPISLPTIFTTTSSTSTPSTSTPPTSTPSAVHIPENAENLPEHAAKTSPPTPGPSHIPKKIWYKMGPKGISPESENFINHCLEVNPEYRHEVFTDITAEIYVRENFAHRPDVVSVYEALTIPILKADLLRYLILYVEGGIWSDLDVSCEEIPINGFIPTEFKDKAGLVVGLEFDEDWSKDGWIGCQFASWWIMSRPALPHMMVIVDDIVKELKQIAEVNGVDIAGIQLPMLSDVVQVTGPKRLTWSVIRSLETTLGTMVDDRNISGLHTPKLIGDVLVMPGNAFAAFQNGEPTDQGPKLVSHHYAGSWKNEKGGED